MFGDTGYEFVQANIKPDDTNLKDLVVECSRSFSEKTFFIENALFTLEGFQQAFTKDVTMTPQWWNHENAMQDFTSNAVIFGNNHKYGDDLGVGTGCWAFYNEKTHLLRIFRWIEDHSSLKHFCNTFQIEACKEEKEDIQTTSVTPSTTNPLQQFALHDLRIIGIILGELGDYARVQTPDGTVYIITIGTQIGKHAGEVVEIAENHVRVKERVQNKHGHTEEVETLLPLFPERD